MMDIFLKYVWLLDLLYNVKRGLTLKEIKARWDNNRNLREEGELDTRTFHRYRHRIEELFSVNIECEHNKYFISNRTDIEEDNIRMWLLNTFSINSLVGGNGQLRKRIIFEDIPSGKNFLTDIIEAMRDNRKIEMNYQSYWSGCEKHYILEPYHVKVFNKRWYMIAYDRKAGILKTFALDRIVELCATAETFQYPKDFDPQTYFNDCFGIIHDEQEKVQRIRLKIYNNQDKYLRDLPLHHSQQIIETTADYSIFEYRIKVTFDLIQEILSHGSDWEVLAPQSLRDDIRRRAEETVKRYKE
jgi:hypothetical protein